LGCKINIFLHPNKVFKRLIYSYFLSVLKTEYNRNCVKESKILDSNALQKPDTEKPAKSLSAKIIIIALITNRNMPNVNMVTGNVNKTMIGFTNMFNTESTNATPIAET
jgi:hypothetical protein